MAFTKVVGPGIHTLSNITSHNIHSSGIITATRFDGPFTNLNVSGVTTFTGDANFGGNVSIAGTLTYEDVTNIDSVGIITAQKDIHVGAGISVVGVGSFGTIKVGTGITFETNGQATFSGITTSRGYEVNGYSDGAATYNYVKVGRLKIYDNGTNNHIFNGYAAPLYLQGSAIRLLGNDIFLYNTASTRYYFRGQNLGAASLYWAGSNNHGVKLATSEKGITVGSGVTIETNGQATYTGIITATAFKLADGSAIGAGAGGTWSTYTAGIATTKSVGVNTSNLDDNDLVGVGNSFQGLYISNGMIIHDNTLSGNHYIGTAFNGLMAGPVNIEGTLSVDGNYVVV